tara:strand:- start:2506 stop:2877 length:372 start_codon:yes stop_codon:yes gene_type:complete
MANPNILTATSVLGKRQNSGPVATSIANLLTCPSSSVYRVLSIRATNIDNSNANTLSIAVGTGTVSLGNATTFLHQKSIAASTSVQILEDPIYLLEGESIAAVVGTGAGGGNVNIMFGFEEIS